MAFDCASHGHDVRLFDFEQFPDNIATIAGQGGIHAEGDISGFGPIVYSGHDIDEALKDAELIYVVGPAYSTEPFGKVVAGKLKAGQTLTEPGRIRVFLKLKAGNLLAALPGEHTADILKLIDDVYPSMEPAESVLQTSLQNANPVIHPAVTLSNAARIEMTGGDFLFYEEGVSDSVGRLIAALDSERIAIGKKLGITILPDPEMGMRQGYMLEANYGSGYRKAPGFLGIGAQPQLDHRYLHEDVGYGLVFMSKLGEQIGVTTPGIDAVINVASIVMARDYRAEALRTPQSLGIADRSAEELAAL
jgi:opine dehydrogenase